MVNQVIVNQIFVSQIIVYFINKIKKYLLYIMLQTFRYLFFFIWHKTF